jgi:hypothetical protein
MQIKPAIISVVRPTTPDTTLCFGLTKIQKNEIKNRTLCLLTKIKFPGSADRGQCNPQ